MVVRPCRRGWFERKHVVVSHNASPLMKALVSVCFDSGRISLGPLCIHYDDSTF